MLPMPPATQERQEFILRSATSDKLQAACNALAEDGWHVHPPHFRGGRDWFITAERTVLR